MRLAAHDLRGVATSLHGLAGARAEPLLAVASAQVRAVAEALHAPGPVGPPVLREELLDLADLAGASVAALSASLSPGTRSWRLPAAAPCWLWADARALRHVLGHVLADAVHATREGDWIELDLEIAASGVTLEVQDEGAGLVLPAQAAPAPRDSRGIGLRLALARRLMEAHGGQLEVEARAGIGTRVRLVFPAERLRLAA